MDIHSKDKLERTPLFLAIQSGDWAQVTHLIEQGSDLYEKGRCGKRCLMYAVDSGDVHLLRHLLELDVPVDIKDDYDSTTLHYACEHGHADMVRLLIEYGADIYAEDHIPYTAIQYASTVEVANILIEHGECIDNVEDAVRRKILGFNDEEDAKIDIDKALYLNQKKRTFGQHNPEVTNNPFWLAMIKVERNAWHARKQFDDNGLYGDPVWCYERFGRTTTVLPSGNIIEIAGEHEDHYDPDFCIYNDVTLFDTDGQITIYSYPEDVFPPTDFHSATLVGENIYIIGNLGYSEHRKPEAQTPVYRLNTHTFVIEKVDTEGESPGWISHHRAVLSQCNQRITISSGTIYHPSGVLAENIDEWELNLVTQKWNRLSKKDWQRYTFFRTDNRYMNVLSTMRSAERDQSSSPLKSFYDKALSELRELLKSEPDFDLLKQLYSPPIKHIATHKKQSSLFLISIDGISVRFQEHGYSVDMTIEGKLPDITLKRLKDHIKNILSNIEKSDLDIKKIP